MDPKKIISSKYKEAVDELYEKYAKKDFKENFPEKPKYACYFCLLRVEPDEGVEIKIGESEKYHVHDQCIHNYKKDKKHFDELLKDNPKEFSRELRKKLVDSYEKLMLSNN